MDPLLTLRPCDVIAILPLDAGMEEDDDDGDDAAMLTMCLEILVSLKYHCSTCGTNDTPQWRKGWPNPVTGERATLCNACGLRYHKNRICLLCHQSVVSKGEAFDNPIIACRGCTQKAHVACTVLYSDMTSDQLRYRHTRGSAEKPYYCPQCSG